MELFKTWLAETYIAHRGLHGVSAPENSMKAFENAIEKNYAIELDVHLIADGTVVVFHDTSLSRMTGKDGYVKNLVRDDLKDCFLAGTSYTIPTLEDVLQLVDGKVPLLIEIKNVDKVGALEKAVIDLLNNYVGEFAIQSFNPFSLAYFKEHAPNFLRGQLACYFKGEKMSYCKKFALKRLMLNKISQPHFISYCAENLPNRFVKKYSKLPLLAWTVKSQKEYLRVVKYCDNIIFEGFVPSI